MNTQYEVLDHLAKGGMVINQYGTTVRLNKYGHQVVTHNPHAEWQNKTYYRFNSPQYWEAYECGTDKHSVNLLTSIVPWAIVVPALVLGLNSHTKYLEEKEAFEVTTFELESMYNEANSKLQKYEATEQEIMDLGASSEQAQEIVKASKTLNVPPKH